MTQQAASEPAGHIDAVTGQSTTARDDALARRLAVQREESAEESRRPLRDVATDNLHPIAACAGGEAAIEFAEPRDVRVRRERERHHGGDGLATHRGDVAEVALEQFRSDGTRWHRVIEMLAVDYRVGRDELEFLRRRQYRAVVADAERRCGRRIAEPLPNLADQPQFAVSDDRLGADRCEQLHVAGRPERMTSTVFRLNKACMVTETRMSPVFS